MVRDVHLDPPHNTIISPSPTEAAINRVQRFFVAQQRATCVPRTISNSNPGYRRLVPNATWGSRLGAMTYKSGFSRWFSTPLR